MRLFQHIEVYPAYVGRMDDIVGKASDYAAGVRAFLSDRYEAMHLLAPVLGGDPEAFVSIGTSERLQRAWARERGLKVDTPLIDILLAQIEEHKTEVFYDCAPMRFDGQLVRRLPACVKRTVAWHAAPSHGADFGAYDMLVCNFPGILKTYREQGWKAEYFYPAFDPEMTAYAASDERPIDLLFVGGYSRHHTKRAELLESFASLGREIVVEFYLNRSRFTALAESFIGRLLPLRKYRRPHSVSSISKPPVFGRDLYKALSRSKIVLNGAIDMAGMDRGNLRCFESMGCGCLLYSDAGIYPSGMETGVNMQTYQSIPEALNGVRGILRDKDRLKRLAAAGHEMIRSKYSKAGQWQDFLRIVQ